MQTSETEDFSSSFYHCPQFDNCNDDVSLLFLLNNKSALTHPMFEQTFKNIDDILYKDSGADSELDYIGQTSWVGVVSSLPV